MKKNISAILIIIIFLLSLFLRLYAVKNVEYKMEYDSLNYHNMAKQFLEKGYLGYGIGVESKEPNAYITPGYPIFIAGVYHLAGDTGEIGILSVKVVQAVLSAITVLLVYFIGKKIANFTVGILAAFFMMVYPSFSIVSAFHLTETLYTFLFILYLYLQIISFSKERNIWHIVTGFVFALAVMVRPTIFPFFVIIYAYRYIIEKDKKAFVKMIYFIVGLFIVMVPWWIRNYLVLHEFILLCTQAGNPLLGGAYPPQFRPRSYIQDSQFAEGMKVIINGFINHPKEYLHWFTAGKLKLIFEQVYLLAFLPQLKVFLPIHFFALGLGSIGVIASLFKNNLRIVSLYLVMLTGIQLMFIPESRYAFSIMPLFMILSGYVIYQIAFIGFSLVKKARANI
jgi:4-amino-4-deoxy-L-arabinose transferase-like glycosyltransferase